MSIEYVYDYQEMFIQYVCAYVYVSQLYILIWLGTFSCEGRYFKWRWMSIEYANTFVCILIFVNTPTYICIYVSIEKYINHDCI